MEPDRWKRIDELFHEVLELAADERGRVLERECGDDAELRAQVEALLRAHASDVSVLDGGPGTLVSVLDDHAASAAGRLIGPFRVVRELGRGGMGVVYLAEREDADFRHVVALKCLLPGVATADLIDRFRRERRILAGLVHPNIAQLHDGGVTESGEPYLVMEFVDGEPIDEFCDRARLGIDARLRLFATACEAVQYAHEHLVVHRDLKPRNVLVTAAGHVKLLDFGIAKLLETDDAIEPAATRTTHALTPGYASPEQLRGDPVTAASDVFSLGLILFELLTGRRAFSPAPGPFGAVRAVLETEPARASTAAASTTQRDAAGRAVAAEQLALRAAARASTPERLRRRLRGDLDTILAKALRLEPARRYGSAQALLDDIRRHLDGLPIQAEPPTRRYRATKFLRRHRTSVAAAAVVLVALLTGRGAALWQAAIAARERDAARAEATKAERVTQFLVSTFAAANPYAPRAERLDTFRVASLLARGAARVREELAAEPAVQVPLMRALGRTYRLLPDLDAAGPLIEDAATLSREVYGSAHPEVAESITELAHLLAARGRLPDAEPLFREALAIRQAALGDQHPAVTSSLAVLAGLLMRRGMNDEADSLLTLALARTRAETKPDSVLLADVLTRKGLLANAKGDPDQALRFAHEALAINHALVGPDHPRSIGDLNNVAVFLQGAGRHEEAEATYREVLERQTRALGAAHPFVVSIMAAHAAALDRIGRRDEARQRFAEAVTLSTTLPPRTAAFTRQRYAAFLASQGEVVEAERWHRDAIATLTAAFGSEDRDVGTGKSSLAALLCTNGRRREAAALYTEAHATLSKLLSHDHREVERARKGLADCPATAGRR